eukprot:s1995_g6.t2
MDLAGSTSVSDPPGAQFQTDPLVHLMVFGTQNPATGGPSGGRGLQPLATFDTRRHGSVAVSQPRSGGFGDICHKEKEPLGKSEAAQRNPGPGLDNRDEGELAENTGPSYPFPPLPPALPSYPEGAEDGYIFGANYKGDAFMGGDDFTDETEATKDSIFKSLSLPSPAVLQVDEGMAQPKSPPGRSSNSGISLLAGVSAGVSKLWRQSDDTGKPWWQSLLSSPARRMADSQNMGGKPQTPAVFRLPPAPLKKPAHAIKSKRASHQDGALKRHDLPKRATVNNVSKPTLKRAVALARSKVAVTKAMKDIELDYFANSSKAAKTAKRNAVEKILAAAFKTPMPLTVDKIRVLAGTLRDCGYKSAQTYIAEAKMTHIEGGWDWPPLLDRHFRLCIKAVNRGQGPAKKAPEVVEDAWGGFPLLQGEGYPSTTVRLAPHLFACGVQWMMREIEIANLHSKDIKFDHNNRMVTLTWNESKTDQEGATIARTLKCMCPAHCDMRCPFAVLEVLSNQACLHGNVGGALAVCHDGTRATKAQLVADWKAIFNDLVTGHSSRRSGALQYIRRGWSVSQVAFLGRWKSNVILEYAREALQTIALNSDSSPFSTLSGMLNAGKDGDAEMNLIPKFDSTNFAQKEVVDKLEEEIKKFVKGTKVSSKKLEEAAASAYVNAKIIIKLINNVGKATSVAESAAILADGSVVTWGDPQSGGDSSEVHDLLKDVQQVQASGWAFAAMLAGGSVVTWGSPDDGGDSSEVQNQLKGVQQLQSTSGAFAAILADESVVTWGSPHFGGDSSQVQDQLKGVQQVQGTPQQALEGGFAAILADGSVVTWGKPSSGGDSSEVQDQLKGVQEVQATWARLLRSWRTGSWYSLVQRQDFDALVFGAPKLLRNLHHGSASPQLPLVQEIRLPEILTQLHFSQLEFVDFCILAGCDYLPTISKDDYYLPPFSLKAIIAEYCANDSNNFASEQAAALALIPSVEAERLGVCPLADLLAAAKCVEIILPDTETQRREWKVSDIVKAEEPQASQAPLRRDTERGPRPSKPERCVYVPRTDRMKDAKNSRPSARLSEYSSSYSSLSVSQRPGRLLAARRVPDRMDRSSPRGSGGVPPHRSYASHVAQPGVSSVAPASRQVYPPWKILGDGGEVVHDFGISSAHKHVSGEVPKQADFGLRGSSDGDFHLHGSVASIFPSPIHGTSPARRAWRSCDLYGFAWSSCARAQDVLKTGIDGPQPTMGDGERRESRAQRPWDFHISCDGGVICQAWAPVVAQQHQPFGDGGQEWSDFAQSPHRIVGYGTYRPAMAPMSAPMRAFPVGIMTAQQLIKKHRNIENILRNLDRAKYVVPEDWNFTGARSCFQPMDLSFVKTSDLKETPQTSWRILGAFREEQPIDTVALRNLLIERHALKPDLINDHLQKLVFLRGCMQPRRALTPHADAPSGPPEHASKDSKEGRAVPQKGASRPASGCARSNARADRLQKQLGTRPPASPQLGSPLRKAFFKGKRNIVQEATPIAKRRRRAVETLQHCFGADLVLPPETPLEELERLVEDTQMEQVSQCTTVPGSSLFRCLSLD